MVNIKLTKKVLITSLSSLPKCPEYVGAMVSYRIKKKSKFVIQEIKNFVNKLNIISSIVKI
ncbi:hypothetical protein [Tissierella praeacuta]|uniref:hypothetical protein n=1 Tax=Tissierella praeacuta TaxID=43131 RepID=UPI0010487116|nr:hypothetical protein [Tissierella praeacuta]